MSSQQPTGQAPHLLLYDGVCVLCNWWVRFVLAHDGSRRFAFAPLQGPTAAAVLARHRLHDDLQSLVLVLDFGSREERVFTRSQAALLLLKELNRPWSLLAVFRLLPASFRDAVYRLVARHRYRWFGRLDSCPLPSAEVRQRFLE